MIPSRLPRALFSLLLLGLVFLCGPARAQAQAEGPRVVFTFDDGPVLAASPRLSAAQRNDALLDTLARRKVSAALFITGGNGADRAEGLAMARAWGQAGHLLGNHTMSHPDLDSDAVSLGQYQQEVLACDRLIAGLPGYRKWFRYTFLREGNTQAKRDGMQAFLASQSYQVAGVSFDAKDWEFDAQLVAALRADPAADLAPIKQAYLAHVRLRAADAAANAARRQNQVQVLLLHHNLLNALWLDEVIAVFQDQGWRVLAPSAASFAALDIAPVNTAVLNASAPN